MKRTNIIILTATFMLTTLTASAQKPVQAIGQAFDECVSTLSKDGYVTSSRRNNYSNGSQQVVNFEIPKKTNKTINDFNRILTDNEKFSYSFFVKKAGTTDSSIYTVAYGENNEEREIFGANKDHNYNVQTFHDRKDSTMRYIYALVWYDNNGGLKGNVYKFYGKDPQQKNARTSSTVIRKDGWTISDDGIVGPGVVIDDDNVTITDEGMKNLINFSKSMDSMGREFDRTFGGVNIDSDNTDNSDFYVIDDDSRTLRTTDGKVVKLSGKTKIKTSNDFISQFNNLHVLYTSLNDKYKDYRNCTGQEKTKMLKVMSYMVAVLNKANDMCSNYYNVLNSNMKKFVADQLRDMAKESKDKNIGEGFKAIAVSLLSQDTGFRQPFPSTFRMQPLSFVTVKGNPLKSNRICLGSKNKLFL